MRLDDTLGDRHVQALPSYSQNPMLQSMFMSFEEDSVNAVAVHAELMRNLGIR